MYESTSTIENHSNKIFKLILFISLSNSLAIIWDINGLGATFNSTYILSKFIFLTLPFFFLYLYKSTDFLRSYMQPAIALTFFAYSAYYMQTVHYSYFTAFIQFYIGLVLFLQFNIKTFLTTYILGFVFLLVSVNSLKDSFPPLEFEQKSSDIMGATLPVYLISILVFFLIKRAEEKAEVKNKFFRNLGENVGFLLHEIKQPLLEIEGQVEESKISDIHELLQVINIMWPDGEQRKITVSFFKVKEEVDYILKRFECDIQDLGIKVEFKGEFPEVSCNKQIFRIIVKNLIKNALEANVSKEVSDKYIKIDMLDHKTLVIKNSIPPNEKINTKKIFQAGFSKKSNVGNKGLGLFITSQLADKANIKVDAIAQNTSFSIKLTFLN